MSIEIHDFINNDKGGLAYYDHIIENGTTEEFIEMAKSYNIFQTGKTSTYIFMCQKIKDRLDREGLDYETVRPE